MPRLAAMAACALAGTSLWFFISFPDARNEDTGMTGPSRAEAAHAPLSRQESLLPRTSSATSAQTASPGVQPTELWDELIARSDLNPLWLQAHGFTQGSAGLRRLHGLLDGEMALTAPGVQKVAFGPQGGSSLQQAGETPVLSPYERFIEAAIQPGQLRGDSVILRWRNASDNAVIELFAQALPSADTPMPVWRFSASDWPQGRYRVEVIAPNADLTLLAEGEFEIAAPGAAVTPFVFTAEIPGASSYR